jgi:ubiquinone/menaquinone biosynthesis C-methylase UbiE/uncharacterized protein YbaR (Trm112 family)
MFKKKDYENILVCSKCKSPVTFDLNQIDCSNCNLKYVILDNIPVMIPKPISIVNKEIQTVKKTKQGMYSSKIPIYKVDYRIKQLLYKLFGIKLPKLKDQRDYWLRRGNEYCDEFLEKGYERLEIFFQDLVIKELKKLKFDSIFEAGCGFGWNIKRFKKEFPKARVGGLDFSHTQLLNGKLKYIKDESIVLTGGDATKMPFKDGAYDIGFSLGVFMNINEKKIEAAIDEMIRVSKKYIVHLEYDEKRTTKDLRERRAFKTNIVSHDYKKLYEKKGLKVKKMLTYKDFGKDYNDFMNDKSSSVDRWEKWEGPGKYILIIIEK